MPGPPSGRGAAVVFEIEIKFQVPPARRAAVQRELATATARTTRLRAQYFDTADRRLAAAGLALRLRQEGRRWAQTLKGAGDGTLHRLEHEVALLAQRGVPRVDLARHTGTVAGAALVAALGTDPVGLAPVFETEVRRTQRQVRIGGACVEVALDLGMIRAGSAHLPICEIEFELKSGPIDGLLALCARWAERHALWLDVRSKAERGDLLARGLQASPAAMAHEPALDDTMDADVALRAIVRACLAQILPNTSTLAADRGDREHLHQARVGLRRLDAALREFADWSDDVDVTWRPALRTCYAPLGRVRDADALEEWLLPELRAAGAPLSELPHEVNREATTATLRAPSGNQLLLRLMAFAHGTAPKTGAVHARASESPSARASSRIARLHRRVARDAAAFASCDDAQRHRTRIRLKRLRYCTEFVAGLCPPKATRRYLARLRPAQEALGRHNDAIMAEAAFGALLDRDPKAWFALGWLRARREQWQYEAQRHLEKLGRAKPFWRPA
jgi:triphosphatase